MYDFNKAIEEAKRVVSQQSTEGGGVSYKYPLIYPQSGNTLTVRPLFNPASGQIVRLVNRHERVACLKTYGMECPICKIQQEVKDASGRDPFGRSKGSRARGICFAQYISSSYQIKKENDTQVIQPGEIVLLMFPWTVYTAINTLIQNVAQTPTGMEQAFSHSTTGLFIQIQVDNNFKYTTTNVPYMTFNTNMTDDDFLKMLDSMDSLNDQVLPAEYNEQVEKEVKEYADEIYRQFISPSIPQAQGYMQYTQQTPVQMDQFTPPAQSQGTGTPYPNPNQVVQEGLPWDDNPFPTNPIPPSGPVPTYAVSAGPPYQMPTPIGTTVAPQAVPQNNPSAPTPSPVPQNSPQPQAPQAPQCFGRHEDNSATCICCPFEVTCIEKKS